MKKAAAKETKPRLRADAARNREHLLEVAKAAFTKTGPHVSLEEIARRAKVGIGTLYRHFPTRDAMVEAVYRREVEQIAAAADRLLDEHPPAEALRQWMRLFVDYLATKKMIAPAVSTIAGGTSALYQSSSSLIRETIAKLLDKAIAAGEVRGDVETADIMQGLAGAAYDGASPGWRDRALRFVDIFISGLRSTPSLKR